MPVSSSDVSNRHANASIPSRPYEISSAGHNSITGVSGYGKSVQQPGCGTPWAPAPGDESVRGPRVVTYAAVVSSGATTNDQRDMGVLPPPVPTIVPTNIMPPPMATNSPKRRSRPPSNRQRHSQARQDRHNARKLENMAKRKFRRYMSGVKRFRKKIVPTHEELRDGVKVIDPNMADYMIPTGINCPDHEVARAAETEVREMSSLLELLSHGGVGILPEKKRPGWIWILFENFNSIGIGTQDWKMDRLNALVTNLKIDIVAGCETNIDWRQVSIYNQFLDLLQPGKGKKRCSLTQHDR